MNWKPYISFSYIFFSTLQKSLNSIRSVHNIVPKPALVLGDHTAFPSPAPQGFLKTVSMSWTCLGFCAGFGAVWGSCQNELGIFRISSVSLKTRNFKLIFFLGYRTVQEEIVSCWTTSALRKSISSRKRQSQLRSGCWHSNWPQDLILLSRTGHQEGVWS